MTLDGTLEAIAAVLALIAIAVAAVVAHRDMNRRGRAGLAYAAMIALAWPIGLLAWRWGRARYPEAMEG